MKAWISLLENNIIFLKGKAKEPPPYYCTTFVDEETFPLVDLLVKMNSKGFYTTSSQPGMGNNNADHKQRAYVTGFITKDLLKKFKYSLPEDILVQVLTFEEEYIYNTFSENSMVVTKLKKEEFTWCGGDTDFELLLETKVKSWMVDNLYFVSLVDSTWYRSDYLFQFVDKILSDVSINGEVLNTSSMYLECN